MQVMCMSFRLLRTHGEDCWCICMLTRLASGNPNHSCCCCAVNKRHGNIEARADACAPCWPEELLEYDSCASPPAA